MKPSTGIKQTQARDERVLLTPAAAGEMRRCLWEVKETDLPSVGALPGGLSQETTPPGPRQLPDSSAHVHSCGREAFLQNLGITLVCTVQEEGGNEAAELLTYQ